jgi:cadmium resistance protein CadD (predicted permease)
MDYIPASIGIGALAFASTNIDDLVMLIGFFVDAAYRPRQIVLGQFVGIGVVIVVSLLGSLVAQIASTAYVGLLGLVPIALGVKKLVSVDGGGQYSHRLPMAASNIVTVAVVTVANGADNLSLYIPLFAVHSGAEVTLFVAIFLVMTALWCGAGYALGSNRLLGIAAQRWGSDALPYILIALGIYILAKTGTLVRVS